MSDMSRRTFVRTLGLGGLGALGCALLPACSDGDPDAAAADIPPLLSDVADGGAENDAAFADTAGGSPETLEPPSAPNIVLITADDLGWKDLSCYGNEQIETPNIDRLATDGVRFDNAFVTASSCSPSRATLATGQYPHTNGVVGLTSVDPDVALPQGYATVAAALRDAGYRTGVAGKWHIAPFDPPDAYGYEERLSGFFPDQHVIRDSETIVDFIDRHQDERFFLEINYMNNHRHYSSGEFEFAEGFPVSPDDVTVPEYWTLPGWPEIREEVAKFWSQTLEMDRLLGEVLAALEARNLTDETLVVFVSDNGPPFPGNKTTLYDRGIGTPLIARWPGVAARGRVDSRLVSTLDLAPTLLAVAGVSPPDAMEGSSLVETLQDEARGPRRDAVFAEMTFHVEPLAIRAVRTERFKYIRNYSDNPFGLDQCEHMDWAHRVCELPNQPWKSLRVPEELYDLSADPHEQTNLIDDPALAVTLATLRDRLEQHMSETSDPLLGTEFVRS